MPLASALNSNKDSAKKGGFLDHMNKFVVWEMGLTTVQQKYPAASAAAKDPTVDMPDWYDEFFKSQKLLIAKQAELKGVFGNTGTVTGYSRKLDAEENKVWKPLFVKMAQALATDYDCLTLFKVMPRSKGNTDYEAMPDTQSKNVPPPAKKNPPPPPPKTQGQVPPPPPKPQGQVPPPPPKKQVPPPPPKTQSQVPPPPAKKQVPPPPPKKQADSNYEKMPEKEADDAPPPALPQRDPPKPQAKKVVPPPPPKKS